MIILASGNVMNEFQEGELQIRNEMTSATKEGNLEKLHITDNELDEEEELKNRMKLYQLFLDGEISVEYEGEWLNASTLGIPTGEPEKRDSVSYSIFDINGDNSPELILAFARNYLYLSVKDGELFVWRFAFSSFLPYITKRREHITQAWAGIVGAEETYNCYLLDYSGNEVFRLHFSRYDYSQDGEFDEKDEYTFDGVKVNQEQWIQLTRRYLYTDDEGNERIKDEIEWEVLFKGSY